MTDDPRSIGYVQTDKYQPMAPRNTMLIDAKERLRQWRANGSLRGTAALRIDPHTPIFAKVDWDQIARLVECWRGPDGKIGRWWPRDLPAYQVSQ